MAKAKDSKEKPRTEQEVQAEKAAAFIRVVTGRVNNAVKSIRLVKQCASSNYVYTGTQAKAVILALKAAVQEAEDAFGGKPSAVGGFQLPGVEGTGGKS